MATIQTLHNEHYGTVTTDLYEIMIARNVSPTQYKAIARYVSDVGGYMVTFSEAMDIVTNVINAHTVNGQYVEPSPLNAEVVQQAQ